MFAIDFTKPWLYKDVIYFNQGNLATNNILRCKLITGGDITLEGYIASVTFKTLSHAEINTSADIADKANCVIDIKFPSNSLEVGVNELEVLLNKGDGNDKVVVQSPKIKYEVWQGLTTGNGVQGDNNYPILIDLMSEVRNTVRIANNASAAADASLKQTARMIEEVDNTLIKVNNTIEATNNAKDEALEAVEDVNRAIAAGTQDLEVKAAREDAEGVTHDTLALRLKSDLKIGSKSLKQEVLDLAGLKESQDMSYETNKGYLVCKETKNGTIKDLVIKGTTVKCLRRNENGTPTTLNNSTKSKLYVLPETVKANTNVYIKINITSKTGLPSGLRVSLRNVEDGSYSYCDGTKGVYNQSFIISHNRDIDAIGFYISSADIQSNPNAQLIYRDWQITLSYTNDYIEGIASVGTGTDKIEVLASNDNLAYNLANVKSTDGVTPSVDSISFDAIKLGVEKTYTIQSSASGTLYYGGTYCAEIKANEEKTFILPSPTRPNDKKPLTIYKSNGDLTITDETYVKLSLGDKVSNNVINKQDKKPLLFKDTDGTWKPIEELRGLDTVCDTVELHNNGKYYYHIRVGKIILNGSEDLFKYNSEDNGFFSVAIDVQDLKNELNSGCISNKFTTLIGYADLYFGRKIGIYCGKRNSQYGSIILGFDKNVVNSVESAKTWLRNNNTTVYYQLAEEKVFEVTPLFLEAYEGETSVLCNSGAIRPNIEFKITSYITNLVLLNQQRISLLEQEMFNMFKQVLSGDRKSVV